MRIPKTKKGQVRHLLAKAGFPWKKLTEKGWTLKNSGDLEHHCGLGVSVLAWACHSFPEAVPALILAGADVNALPSIKAAWPHRPFEMGLHNNPQLLFCLMDAGANLDVNQSTQGLLLILNRHESWVQKLPDRQMALGLACIGWPDLIEELLLEGAFSLEGTQGRSFIEWAQKGLFPEKAIPFILPCMDQLTLQTTLPTVEKNRQSQFTVRL